MALSKRIALWVFGMWLIASTGMMAISFINARNFFINRIAHYTEQTAAVLATTLENKEKQLDKNHLHRILQKRISRGDALRIVVQNETGTIDGALSASPEQLNAPPFFISFVDMPLPIEKTPIIRNGKEDGMVEVTANNRYAIEALWTYSLELLLWNFVSILLACTLVAAFVSKLLKPLQKTTRQARDLLNDEYHMQSVIPNTPELRDLTLAMNKMVRRIQITFQDKSRQMEVLRQQVFQDPLTGLGNRRFFLHQVAALTSDIEGFVPYYLLFIAIDGLTELNEKEGYVEGDKVITEVHHAITEFVDHMPASCIARVGGGQFGILLQAQDKKILDDTTLELQRNLHERLQRVGHCEAFIGGAPCRFLQPVESLLKEADNALQIARENRKAVHIIHDETGLPDRAEIDELLSNSKLVLYWQVVTNTKRVLHREMYARIISADGEEFGAGTLLPIAEQAGLAWKIDNMILKAMEDIDPHLLDPFSVSISSNTVLTREHLDTYLKNLSELPAGTRRMIHVDLSENLVIKSPDEIKICIGELQKLGVGVGIEKAGIHFGSMDYLNDLPIHYFKLHGSITKDIVENESKEVFIRHFTTMAKALDIQVIATQIENESQWAALNTAGITWGQGRFLGSAELFALPKTPRIDHFAESPAD